MAKKSWDETLDKMYDTVHSPDKEDPYYMVDPIVYRKDYPRESIIGYDPMADLTPEYLANMDYGKDLSWANESFSQYWDDSSPEYQSKSKWWLNDKYTWEGVRNADINYNPDLMLADLNPNFVYGLASKVYGSDHPWYITQRNDQIASALYNEWKTAKDDVAYFLWQQNWWMNSSEADRSNTIEAIYKRLWDIAANNPKEESDSSKADEIMTDTSGKIYWKTETEEWDPREWINTLSDANSIFRDMEASRIAELKNLISMSPKAVATVLLSWGSVASEQTMRDAQLYYPEFMAEVEFEKKKIKTQNNVTAIANGWDITTTADNVDTSSEKTSFAVNNSTASVDATTLLQSIDSILSSKDTAKSAQELMWSIEEDMATLKNRLKNLKKEATSLFKWDVPDYIYKAFINNRTQEIQDQLSILEDRYNAAYDRYKTELWQAQREAEYQLKKDSLELDWWKAKNWTSTTSTTNTNYSVAERNNNPTNMTVWFMERAWAELWVDYEVSPDSFWSNWKQLYYAKLLWDPVETTIKVIDKAIANGKNPFNTTSWSYINELWMTVDKWNKMTAEEKRNFIVQKWLPREWWDINNMAYYVNSATNRKWTDYDYKQFEQFRDAKTESAKKAIADAYRVDIATMNDIVRNALANRESGWALDNPSELTWFDYVWLTKEQIAEIEKKIGYNPNIEWELKKIIDKWIPTSWPAMQNVLKTVRAKDEEQLWQWIDHYTNKVNAEAVNAWEDILLLLAQLQNAYADADRIDYVTKDWKTKAVFDTKSPQWRWWWEIWIKYEQLINQLLLNKVTEAREKWATFWQMTEYEWKILENAASALKIKFWRWSSDESFSNAFFDLVNATWKLTNWTNTWPTGDEWNNYVKQVKDESEWYKTNEGTDIDGSNLWWGGWWNNDANNEETMAELF